MIEYYKATRPDGTDFRTGTVDYGATIIRGETLVHPSPRMIVGDPSTYLSVSTEPAETLVGGCWPCRLFRVEPVGDVLAESGSFRYKRAVSSLRVVAELPAHRALGPNGAQVALFIKNVRAFNYWRVKDAARDAAQAAARDAAGYAAWDAAGYAARAAARAAAGYAARAAAQALVIRDVLASEHFAVLTRPWFLLTGEEL